MASASASAITGSSEPGPSSNGLGYTAPSSVSQSVPSTTSGKGKCKETLEIKIEFGGGLHLLFSQQPKHTVHIPATIPDTSPPTPTDMRFLVKFLKSDLLSEREEMFGEGDGVRPGILVLINDADWELEGELEYELRDGDEVVFISTLHGG